MYHSYFICFPANESNCYKHLCTSFFMDINFHAFCARFGSTYTKIGTIQRRLAWPLCKDDTQIREALHIFQTFGLCGEGKGGMFQENSTETCILSRVKQITSPGWMHETSAWTWCTGKT